MPSLTIGLSLAAMRPPGRTRWWASAAWQAEDTGTGLTLGPTAILDFGGRRYAFEPDFWTYPRHKAREVTTGRWSGPAAILGFTGDQYAFEPDFWTYPQYWADHNPPAAILDFSGDQYAA
ncbi:hypothetical protein [Martelella sp. AD-3]|uniref:hypothetical protein n=1 Tax=Martelella sp. AD-3 TaxID=686597 RepID=UPI0004634A45|nr:hypothetical protein [Martelella sp. AD-3]AMM84806.1 hypothetical protein AZF01_10925 [Martelella sp. AD-3]